MPGDLEDYHLGAFRRGARDAAKLVLGPVAAVMAGLQAGDLAAHGRLMPPEEMLLAFFLCPLLACFSWPGAVSGLLTAGLLARYWLNDSRRGEMLLGIVAVVGLARLWLAGLSGWGIAWRSLSLLLALATAYTAGRLCLWWFWKRRVHRVLAAQKRNRALHRKSGLLPRPRGK